MEAKTKFEKLKDITKTALSAYQNYELTNYLKTLTSEELEYLEHRIGANDITGPWIDIFNSLHQEKEYRVLSTTLSLDTSRFLTDSYSDLLKNVSKKDLFDSLLVYSELGVDYDYLLKWLPVFVSVKDSNTLYHFLKKQGLDDDKIIEVFGHNFSESKDLIQRIHQLDSSQPVNPDPKPQDYLSDTEYTGFIKKAVTAIERKKAGTESYDLYIKHMMSEDKEIMKRLM